MVLVPYRRRLGSTWTRLDDEMNDLFGRFFDTPNAPPAGADLMPALDVVEQDDAIVVAAELPGISAEDIDISVENNVLSVRGEKKEASEGHQGKYHHVERRYGTFHRSVRLPGTVDAGKIDASYLHGVLTITLPKSEAAKPRKIEVKTE